MVSEKNDANYIVNPNFARTKVDSYNSLLTERTLTFHNVIILVKSHVNKYKNDFYFNMFLEKGLFENKSNR